MENEKSRFGFGLTTIDLIRKLLNECGTADITNNYELWRNLLRRVYLEMLSLINKEEETQIIKIENEISKIFNAKNNCSKNVHQINYHNSQLRTALMGYEKLLRNQLKELRVDNLLREKEDVYFV